MGGASPGLPGLPPVQSAWQIGLARRYRLGMTTKATLNIHALRLNFGLHPPALIKEGFLRIGEAWRGLAT